MTDEYPSYGPMTTEKSSTESLANSALTAFIIGRREFIEYKSWQKALARVQPLSSTLYCIGA